MYDTHGLHIYVHVCMFIYSGLNEMKSKKKAYQNTDEEQQRLQKYTCSHSDTRQK